MNLYCAIPSKAPPQDSLFSLSLSLSLLRLRCVLFAVCSPEFRTLVAPLSLLSISERRVSHAPLLLSVLWSFSVRDSVLWVVFSGEFRVPSPDVECACVFLDLRFLLQKKLLDFLRRFIYVFLFCGEELWSGFFLGVYAYGTKEFSTDVCSVFLCSGDKVLSALLLFLSLFVARHILCRAHSLPCVLVSLISLRGSV